MIVLDYKRIINENYTIMRTIFKQKLDVCDVITIELPRDFRILYLAMQDGVPCIWYECHTEEPIVCLDIYCFGTGYNMDNLQTTTAKYIGTVQQNNLVWHYYVSNWPKLKSDIEKYSNPK